MEGVFETIGLAVGEKKNIGVATLSTFEFKNSDNPLFNLRAYRDGGLSYMYDGKYVRLHIGKQLMMSDTNMEKRTNTEFVNKAHGRVMIAGLGIGLIIENLKDKIKSGEVTEIVIIEKYQDVIDLVSPYYSDLPIKYICNDILEYMPAKDEIYDTIYFDIWPDVDYDNNLPQIKMLHNRWKSRKRKDNPKAWMNSWMKEYMQAEKRRDNKSYYD